MKSLGFPMVYMGTTCLSTTGFMEQLVSNQQIPLPFWEIKFRMCGTPLDSSAGLSGSPLLPSGDVHSLLLEMAIEIVFFCH